MARFGTFIVLTVVAYYGVSHMDNVFYWMSERRETLAAEERLQRESRILRNQLLKEAKERAES